MSMQFNNGSGEDEDLFFVSIASNAGTSLTTGFYSETEALHFFNHIKNWLNETERTQHLP